MTPDQWAGLGSLCFLAAIGLTVLALYREITRPNHDKD